MSDAYQVVAYGADTSGRTILMNRRMIAAFEAVVRRLGFTPTIVQGAYMVRVGGGAPDSAGYHDAGGCIDTRTWDLTDEQQVHVIHAARSVGWAVWKRDQAHGGMDEHMHWVLLGDEDAAPGARLQMSQYRAGGDGMGGSDYHWRPDPIPMFHYHPEDDDMQAEDFQKIRDIFKDVLAPFRENTAARDKKLLAVVSKLLPLIGESKQLERAVEEATKAGADDATRQQLRTRFRDFSDKQRAALNELAEALQTPDES